VSEHCVQVVSDVVSEDSVENLNALSPHLAVGHVDESDSDAESLATAAGDGRYAGVELPVAGRSLVFESLTVTECRDRLSEEIVEGGADNVGAEERLGRRVGANDAPGRVYGESRRKPRRLARG
jgi:hypothetical protein